MKESLPLLPIDPYHNCDLLAIVLFQTFIFCISWAFGSFLEDSGRAKLEVKVECTISKNIEFGVWILCLTSFFPLQDFHEREHKPEAAQSGEGFDHL